MIQFSCFPMSAFQSINCLSNHSSFLFPSKKCSRFGLVKEDMQNMPPGRREKARNPAEGFAFKVLKCGIGTFPKGETVVESKELGHICRFCRLNQNDLILLEDGKGGHGKSDLRNELAYQQVKVTLSSLDWRFSKISVILLYIMYYTHCSPPRMNLEEWTSFCSK